MTTRYKLYNDDETNTTTSVFKIDGNITKSIPFNESNKDYQEYLEWVAKGNTPEEAENMTTVNAAIDG